MSKDEQITAVIVEPNKEPYEKTFRAYLEDFQKIVGGCIETTCDDDLPGMLIICNDEGKLNGLEFNRVVRMGEYKDYIMGTFFVVGSGYDDFESLTPEQAQAAVKRFALVKNA